MRGQEGAGVSWGMWAVAVLFLAAAIIGLIINTIINPAISATKELTSQASNDIEMVELATSACSLWRSPPVFYDAAALCPGIAEAVVNVFPYSDCSAENPVACEAACSCLLKLQKYCNIGAAGSGKSLCLDEGCRVQMEG